MLGQPVSMLIPEVVGFKLHGKLPAGATATDLVLTVTEMLRKKKVVGKFVEFYGTGLSARSPRRPRDDRQHGARVRRDDGLLPRRRGDAQVPAPHRPQRRSTSRSSRRTRRRRASSAPTPRPIPVFTDTLELDLGTVEPSLAGPKRPQDRVPLSQGEDDVPRGAGAPTWRSSARPRRGGAMQKATAVSARAASSSPALVADADGEGGDQQRRRAASTYNGQTFTLRHGAVVIAAITSCTNTSNPCVMLAAGLLARKAVAKGLDDEAVGEDVARAGLEGRHRLLQRGRRDGVPRPARLQPRRLRLHDVHRQLRPAARADRAGDRGATSWSSPRCSRATATSRGASIRSRASTISRRRRSSSRTRSPAAWTSTSRASRSASAATARCSCATSGRRRRRCRTRSCAA